jgi:alanine dehydrogenase
MKFGIIKERKNPSDRRVVFSPDALLKLKQLYPDVEIKVESSDVRVFTDDDYRNVGIEVADDSSDCAIFFGIKEVPIDSLIENKSYFFFSNTIKEQANNQKLLQAMLEKKIDFYDYEAIVNHENSRLISFDNYTGIVGAYNAIRAFGIKFELFKLPKAGMLSGKAALITHLKRIVLPPLKFVVTGNGIVGSGVKEVLEAIKIKKVAPNDFLTKNFTQAVYTQIDVLNCYKRKDGFVFDCNDFFENPIEFVSNFEPFTKVSDIFISGHFHGDNAPIILTREMLQANNCKIKIVADISPKINGPIACTLRPTTIEDPFYGYLPSEDREVDVFHPAAIVVMAVDNLSSELPIEASEGFGQMMLEYVIPAFFNKDKEGILQGAKITEKGKLTNRFSYLQDFVDGK